MPNANRNPAHATIALVIIDSEKASAYACWIILYCSAVKLWADACNADKTEFGIPLSSLLSTTPRMQVDAAIPILPPKIRA